MARLHEYQGKAILAENGFKIPRGQAASNADEAVAAAKELGAEVVVKIQAWTTGRAGIGGVAFAKKPEDVRTHAERMLAMKVGHFHRQHPLSRSEEHTSELQSRFDLVCRLLLEKKKQIKTLCIYI